MYQAGTLILAAALLIDGLSGIMQSRTAKIDYQRCEYIIMERLFGGNDLAPSKEALEDSFGYFNFVYHSMKMLMIALSFIIV